MAAPAESKEAYKPQDACIVPAPQVERGFSVHMDASPDGTLLVYTNGNNVVIRDLETPSKGLVYSEHTSRTRVARFSPSGYYVASGDDTGKVRVWAYNNVERTLKHEDSALGGAVMDVAWDGDNKRIAAVGGGHSKAKVFAWDRGSKLAEVIPPTKQANACALKLQRPFRFAFGGEDYKSYFYHGVPFKYEKSDASHKNFVNGVKFSPDGAKLLTVSADKTGVMADGKTGEKIGLLDPEDGHKGAIYNCAWAPDSTRCVTCSADKTLKVWDAASLKCLKTIVVGDTLGEAQMAVTWTKTGKIISLSLSGALNYFDGTTYELVRVVNGHKGKLKSALIDPDTKRLFTVCSDGQLMAREANNEFADGFGDPELSTGAGHGKLIVRVVASKTTVATIGYDNKLRLATNEKVPSYTAEMDLPSQPSHVSIGRDTDVVAVVCGDKIVMATKEVVQTEEAKYDPVCTDISADGTQLAVGGKDKQVHLYTIKGDGTIEEAGTVGPTASVPTSVAFSPDGTKIATGDDTKEVRLFKIEGNECLRKGFWTSHTSRITDLKWNPAGTVIASVGVDKRVCFFKPEAMDPVKEINSSISDPIVSLSWVSDAAVWIFASDGVMRRYEM